MYTLEDIQAVDMEVANAITDEFERQNSHIELIASENWVSKAVMSAMGSVLTNKYAEGYPGKRYYGGCECVDVVEELARELNLSNIQLIPVSATEGDNVTKNSENIPWYTDKALLPYLEDVKIEDQSHESGFYMPVQRVCRPDHTFRGFQGQIENGSIAVGDEITTLPSNETAKVKSIHIGDKEANEAQKGQPVTIQLDREVDVSRGCVLSVGSDAKVASAITATLLWMDDDELHNGKNFFVKLGTKTIPGTVTHIEYAIDVNTGEKKPAENLSKNEIAVCKISFADRIVVDEFNKHKTLGELILIDRITNMTSACGVVEDVHTDEVGLYEGRVDRKARAAIKGQKAITVPFVQSAYITRDFVEDVEKQLNIDGRHTYLYAPTPNEDIDLVIKHLHRAGLVVLLLVDKKQADTITNKDEHYISDWNKTGLAANEVAKFIAKESAYSDIFVHERDYI